MEADESGMGAPWMAVPVTNCGGSHSALAQGSTASHLAEAVSSNFVLATMAEEPSP